MLFRDLPVIRSLSPVHIVRIDSRFPDRLDQQLLILRIDIGSRLIEYEHRRVF